MKFSHTEGKLGDKLKIKEYQKWLVMLGNLFKYTFIFIIPIRFSLLQNIAQATENDSNSIGT